MANASETLPDTAIRTQVGACGSCTYTYNQTDGCYHRQSFGCNGNCTCSAMICGLGSQILRRLFPASANATVGVVLSCSASGSDEESCREFHPRPGRRPGREDDLLEARDHRAGRALGPAGDRAGGRAGLPVSSGRIRWASAAARAVDLAAGSL